MTFLYQYDDVYDGNYKALFQGHLEIGQLEIDRFCLQNAKCKKKKEKSLMEQY